jgi:parallel beta-helix repeat protein
MGREKRSKFANDAKSTADLASSLAQNAKQLGNRKIVDASEFANLQSAIDFTTSISGILYVDQINESTNDISITCSIYGKYAKSSISCRSLNIGINQKDIVLKDFKLTTDYCIAINVNRGCENITLDNLEINPGTNYGSLNPQKRLSVIASGVDTTTTVKNLRIKNCKMWIGGIQITVCDNFVISDNFIDGNWQNIDEHIHISYKSRGTIKGNTLLNSLQDGIDIYSSGDRCIITNNRIIGVTLQGIEAKVTLRDDPSDTSSDTLGYVESTIISNNIIRDIRGIVNTSGNYLGINVAYYDNRSVKSFDGGKQPNNIIIEGNLIEDFYTVPFTSGNPIFQGILFNGSNGLIKGNIIRGLKTHVAGLLEWRNAAIVLPVDNGSSNSKVIIEGNVINSDITGIYITNLQDSIISNNVIAKDRKTGFMPRYGIYVDGTGGVMDSVNIHNNQFECKTTYVDINSATQQITGHAVYASGTSVVKDCNVIGNKTKNASISLYTANFTLISQNNVTPKSGITGIDLSASTYRFGNKVLGNILHSDGTGYGILFQYQKGFVVAQNTIDNFNTAIYGSGYVANTLLKDNMQLYDTGDSIFGTCVRLGATGIDSATIVQTDNSQVLAA